MMLKVCGIAIICLVCALIFKGIKSSWAYLCAAAGGIVIIMIYLGSYASETVAALERAASEGGFSQYAEVLVKALGISYLAAFTSDICRGAGEEMLAGTVMTAGKAEILLLTLPLAGQMLDIAAQLLGR